MTVRPDIRYPGPTAWTRAKWLMEASPADYLLALSVASASLPVVGKRLEPLGVAAAMGVFGARIAPEFMAATARSMCTPGLGEIKRRERDQTHAVSDAALRGFVPDADLDITWPAPESKPPLWNMREHRRNIYRSSVQYGPLPTQLLDVWRPKELPSEPAPVLIFVPGGAWVHGTRILQGYEMMAHLASQGWVCLSIDYRVAPHNRWPAHLIDVKTAIAWARANVDKFGGDRNFVAISGSSAGGHLASLAGLTGNDPELQAELPEGSDTTVDAVVGLYGRYDWEDRSTVERARFMEFLEKIVVNRKAERHPEIFRKASPIARVHSAAPPFLVVHGSADTIIPVEQARDFVERLRSVSRAGVSYIELPGAGHGFDMLDGARTKSMATAVGLFLREIHRNRTLVGSQQVV